jgi:hypothetical protein
MAVSGKWYSPVGSMLVLEEHGAELTGKFDSTENPGGGAFDVHGSVDPDVNQPDRALSFSVAWMKGSAPLQYRSVTSYTGQYHKGDGEEVIDVVFLLVNETTPAQSFSSVSVASDVFTRNPPSDEEVKRAATKRRRH